MNLYLFDENEIVVFTLPDKKIGNFWMTDEEGKNIININAKDNEWYISGGNNSKIILNGNYIDETILNLKSYYLVEKNLKKFIIFVDNFLDNTFLSYRFNTNGEIKIGKNANVSDICFSLDMLSDIHGILSYNNGHWNLKKENDSFVYINNNIVNDENVIINNGDVLNIYGLRIVFVFNILFINNPFGNIRINNNLLLPIDISVSDEIIDEELTDAPLYRDDEYFFKSPRLRRAIDVFDMKIDSPPKKEDENEMPLIYTLGPMLTMGASSVVNLTDTMSKVGAGERTWKDAAPSLIVSGCMICSMLVWPFLTKSFQRRVKVKNEKKRQLKYKNYIAQKRKELKEEYDSQVQILEENLLSTEVCYDTILNKKRTLWERKIDQDDFLTVRVGNGQVPFEAKINYHIDDFSMDDDNLISMLDDLVGEFSTLNNVPIGYSFAKNNITAVNGIYPKTLNFINNMLLQMMAFHSYDNLKIVIFTNEKNQSRWEYLKNSLYCFTFDRSMRFFATNTEEMENISVYLDKIFNFRKDVGQNKDNKNAYMMFDSYYLIIIDDIDLARKISIVEDVLEEKNNLGFSLLIIENRLSKLPSQCNSFLSIGDKTSGILINDSFSNSQTRFNAEVLLDCDMNLCTYTLANVPIFIDGNSKKIPDMVTFLEMFKVGQAEQLNCINRWKDNDPTKSLKTAVGLNENNDTFLLDLHEKFHGPHGLVAGMTGSGKSEFIITYILSMAVNYSPEEVSFVLIDYKGGGLAGAFENKELGIKLPHIVGTITNLDKTEINRALASIDSELRRRQHKFNEVRESTGESTIDIYKYQKMYRQGIVDEPMPHLIIVSDEFAELKAQQPDFMEDLISTARIGRSLGVHLILATQKPSGVVDAQIWSNSKFKVCLKVQDKSDSMEMIKCADAAELKNVGRFYLQVGYNEYFALGQSAWAGAPYFPSKEFKKQVDKNIYFIDNVGGIYKTVDNSNNKKANKSEGEELANVLKYIIDVSNTMNLKIRQLWMDKLSNFILLSNLFKKYNYIKKNYYIEPIIGEYDDPSNQCQGLLTLPITNSGNSIIYGMADSGRDEFLQSLVYSIITTYDTTEVNMYLIDFGAETLINFKDAPQVGDVILNSDEDKLNSIVKFLNVELNDRKKLFLQYNGNYVDYIKLSGNTVPNIVIIINVIEVFTDNYLELFDKIFPVIRDGSKYGINFVFTTTSQNSVRFKIAQTCKRLMCLQLTNDIDYRDILGNTNGVLPSKNLSRGIVKLDKICEFQTAFIDDDENLGDTIRNTINLLNEKGLEKANCVPIMPEVITLNQLADVFNGIKSIPLGITKEDLNYSTYDFSKNVVNIISSSELDNTKSFISNFIKLLEMDDSFNKVVIDANNYFEEFNSNIKLFNSNFNGIIDSLKINDDNIQDILKNNNMNIRSLKKVPNNLCVIIGFEKFYSRLDDEHKKIFKEILSHNKEVLKINFILVDIPSAFKKYEYEDWYKNNFDVDDGLWIGAGVSQQFVIKLSVQLAKLSNIDNDYAILVKNGNPEIIKLVNEIK